VFEERPRTLRLAGIMIKHDHGLSLVYGAAMTGWAYVICSALLPLLRGDSVDTARENATASPTWLPLAIAVAVGGLAWFLIRVFDSRGDDRRPPPPRGERLEGHEPKRSVSLLIRSGDSRISNEEALIDANRPARAKPL
jgi:hypothetical protein